MGAGTSAGTSAGPVAPISGWEDTTPDGDSLTLAAVRAMTDRAARWAEAAGGTVRRVGGLVLADALSPCVFLNAAVSAGPVDLDAARAVATAANPPTVPALPTVPPVPPVPPVAPVAVMATVATTSPGRPWLLVTPHPTPDLRPAGLQPMGHPHFMVRPADRAAPPLPSGVTVTEVDDPGGLAEWGDILAAGFPAPASPVPPALLGGPARFWLAHADGRPVATALSWTGHGVVDVECVTTLPRYRGRGLGAAVTWAATLADPALPAVLISSDDGHGVYRRMGYLPVSRWTLWYRPSLLGRRQT
ncbi:GNAT family N-acetyltransferase [Pseudonocardia kujensis]|uniref:GNAT family N-acetyltransferase n=1 Tax=Pseudonocardia kujensis TaxID=1128675 RepID=UPI001E29245C|nr:GNAT family N-acetyltransferase [Pseudonocardia kujensis]MCE0765672.1 GNAT family N-acetyltransferase [Pseudonocardia kujensis]